MGPPPSEEARAYQLALGAGDGRRIEGVVPHSLQDRRLVSLPRARPHALIVRADADAYTRVKASQCPVSLPRFGGP